MNKQNMIKKLKKAIKNEQQIIDQFRKEDNYGMAKYCEGHKSAYQHVIDSIEGDLNFIL